MKRAIEEGFPIVEINRLAVPERNAFKPIYQMHKWFARRASSVFRAILLGCLKPAGTDIMTEFYKDHTSDPDTVGKVILDPFMGGGTTVVEALRLGCKVIGIDLNPVAWFIVKTEVEPVDLDELEAAFNRLADRTVPWSGKFVQETLLEQYKTTCPCCGSADADIIYTFWVKSAVCTNAGSPCERKTLIPLFPDYIIAQKSPSIRYWRDACCPRCDKTFDWEVEPATLLAEADLMVTSPTYSAGVGRTTARWAYSTGDKVNCPWCKEQVTARPSKTKLERKKVPLTVLLCPFCEAVWQWRGDLPEAVDCPSCHRTYKPLEGNALEKGKFVCPTCGMKDAVIQSVRQLPEDQLLPMHPYAMQGYCGRCGGDEDEEDDGQDLLGQQRRKKTRRFVADHSCWLSKSNGKFFTRVRPADLARYQAACEQWEKEKERLPYPKSEIPWGDKTKSGLIAHHYRYWHQMFNPRQLVCLSTLLAAIFQEPDQALKEQLLMCFSSAIESSNLFTRYRPTRKSPGGQSAQGVFARHDFQPKLTITEQNVWGLESGGQGTFSRRFALVIQGKQYLSDGWDLKYESDHDGNRRRVLVQTGCANPTLACSVAEILADGSTTCLLAQDTRTLSEIPTGSLHFVVTDPPYAGNVNYAELADFWYVWLRLILAQYYLMFSPETTPKAEEIIENPTRGKTLQDFEDGLAQALRECHRVLSADGTLAFTFHHSEDRTWISLLRALLNAGFEIEGDYPIHGEAESSLHLMDKAAAIAYDRVYICKKKPADAAQARRTWASIRQEVRRQAREEIKAIEAGRYGKEMTLDDKADVTIILVGKCLGLYSRHYGTVVDHEDRPLELGDALKEIRNLVDQLISREQPLPSELEDIDAESRIYLLTLCDRKEVKGDEVHKATRGILEPEDLIEAGLMIRGRAGRGRTYEVKQPSERFQNLLAKFRRDPVPQGDLFGEERPRSKRKEYFIDYVHLLMALAEGGENLMPWLDRFRGKTPRLRAACDYLSGRNKSFGPVLKKIRNLIEGVPLFPGPR